MLHTVRCIILSSIFNFEIIVDSESCKDSTESSQDSFYPVSFDSYM